ncbi:MAG: hypothetical protein LUG91_00315 [Ruminococcus sp.]|nr:hypothetical protein [Ruminococcus sp.]
MKRKIRFNFPILFALCSLIIIAYTTIVTLAHGGIYDMFMGTILTEIFIMVMFIFALAIYKCINTSSEKNMFAFFAFLLTFAVQSASAICFPFQAYRSDWPSELITNRQNSFLIQMIVFFVVFLICSLLPKSEKWMQKNIKNFVYVPITVNLMFGIYFLLTSGNSADIKGYMIGLPLLAEMVFSFSIYHSFYRYVTQDNTIQYSRIKTKDKITYILIAISSLIIILGYVHRHEYGIPIFFILSCFAWAFFEQHNTIRSKKSKLLFYGISSFLIVIGILTAIFTYIVYKSAYNSAINEGVIPKSEIEEYVSNISIFHNLGSKVGRVFLDTGVKFIRSAGAFGSSTLVYDWAANNDYALGLQIHNFGIVWLIIITVLIVLWAISGSVYLSKSQEKRTIFDTAKSLSFFCITILLIYPLLSNVGLVAIIGVSAYASGYSIMHSIMSAMLLSFALYERR